MKLDNGRPAVGNGSSQLGVRTEGDIVLDHGGHACPGQGGMSVDPTVDDIDPRYVPKRLHRSGRFPGAIGNNSLFIWTLGEGEFVDGPVAEKLLLRRNPVDVRHGFVEPDSPMTFDEYQQALAATRNAWQNTNL